MAKLDKQMVEMAEELRKILGQVEGVEGISETTTLSYVIQVEDEKSKENVNAVAEKLEEQAEKYGLFLEITPATESDLAEAKQKFEQAAFGNKKQATFKA